MVHDLTAQMQLPAANLEFEKAADLVGTIDEINERIQKYAK